jgi:hypothetical protein
MSSGFRGWVGLLALALGACAVMPRDEPRFGPAEPGLAPMHAGATAVPAAAFAQAPKAFVASTRRVDPAVPGRQNWEPSLAVVRRGTAGSAGDDVSVLWMTGDARSDGLTTTGLAAARSRDGFRTQAFEVVSNPPELAGIPFHPMTVADVAEGRLFRGAMARPGPEGTRPGLWIDGGARAAIASTDVRVDKGWLAVGPRPGGQAGRVLYVTYNLGVQRSLDGGATFAPPDPMPQGATLPHPRVLPDGRLAMAYYRTTGNESRFASSTDEGRSWTADSPLHRFSLPIATLFEAVPGPFRIAPLPVWARDPRNGWLYAVLPDITATLGSERDVDLLMYRSLDEGRSWTRLPLDLRAPPYSDQFVPWIEIDAAGRLHLAWFETRPTAAGDMAPTAQVHTWYARSDDGGVTWTPQRLTEAPIDSGGTQWSPIAPSLSQQFVGDYLALDVSNHAAYVAHPAGFDGAVAMAVTRIEFAATSDTVRDPRGLAGAWFDPATSGQGLSILWIPGGILTTSFFGYRNDGSNLWLLGIREGPVRFGETMVIPLDLNRGGRFGGFTPSQVERVPWGTLTLRFDTCTSGEAILNGLDGRQTMALTKLVGIEGLGCD